MSGPRAANSRQADRRGQGRTTDQATASAGLAGTTIHDLRHTAASLLIAAGADVKAVQTILGHATTTMTMDLCGHLFSEAPWLAMERMPTFPERPMPPARPVAGEPSAGWDGPSL